MVSQTSPAEAVHSFCNTGVQHGVRSSKAASQRRQLMNRAAAALVQGRPGWAASQPPLHLQHSFTSILASKDGVLHFCSSSGNLPHRRGARVVRAAVGEGWVDVGDRCCAVGQTQGGQGQWVQRASVAKRLPAVSGGMQAMPTLPPSPLPQHAAPRAPAGPTHTGGAPASPASGTEEWSIRKRQSLSLKVFLMLHCNPGRSAEQSRSDTLWQCLGGAQYTGVKP